MAGYIGSKVAVVSSGAERKKVFTATSGQTSFTGLSYTVNNVHVFQNGVRLVDGTDYTATNGNSITLTVGAATDDQVVVVSYNTFQTSDTVSASAGGTFTGDVNFTGAFTSQGIDDNATSTAMTLDASGNLLVGQSSTSIPGIGNTTNGVSIRSGGNNSIAVSRDGDVAGYFNRNTSDGEIIQFRKDGSAVGSIGNLVTTTYIETSGQTGLGFYSSHISPRYNGSGADATADLGRSSQRFKDLYLSGGAYLGGTGSSNKLDDYEEGTWTPTNNGTSNVTIDNRGAKYTKIGQLVTIQMYIGITATSTDACAIGGLPFAATSTTNEFAVGTINHNTSAGEGLCRISHGTSLIRALNTNNNSKTWNQFNNSFIITTISYITDA